MNKTIRKLLCLFLILATVSTLAACGSDRYGRYNLVSVSMNGQSFTIQELKDYIGKQDDMYLDLRDDGTATMVFLGESSEMLWEDDKIWPKANASKASFTIEENTLTMDMNGITMVFQK